MFYIIITKVLDFQGLSDSKFQIPILLLTYSKQQCLVYNGGQMDVLFQVELKPDNWVTKPWLTLCQQQIHFNLTTNDW